MTDDYKPISEAAAYDAYNEWLNDVYPVEVAGIPLDAAEVLKNCDPIAYNVGFSDFLDNQGLEVL